MVACPPSTRSQWPSAKPIFCVGSSRRELTRIGRRCSCSAVSAMRAERLAERTDANVATASTRVPPAVASEEIVTQSAIASALAVEHRHLRRGVAVPGGRAGRDRRLDAVAVGLGELDVEGAERLVEAVAAPRADQRHDLLAAIQDPGDGELRDADAALLR